SPPGNWPSGHRPGGYFPALFRPDLLFSRTPVCYSCGLESRLPGIQENQGVRAVAASPSVGPKQSGKDTGPMKVTIERGAFLKALNHVQSVVERRNTIPILSNVMIEAAKGRLKLTATDLDMEIVETLTADVLRNGAATAPAHM